MLVADEDSGQEQAGHILLAQGNVVVGEGAQHKPREDLAHAQPRLAQPHIAPHYLRVAALLPQLREASHQLPSHSASTSH